MARLDSPYWNTELGVCTKHHLPQTPCPQCIATKDPDIEVVLSDIEKDGWVEDIELYIPVGFENHTRR